MSTQVSEKILRRVYLLFGGVALFSFLIIYKVVKIQFFEKDKWTAAVEKDRIVEKRVPAARGNLLSDEGKVLATSQPFYMLPIDPSRLPVASDTFDLQLDSLCKLLAQRFGTVDRTAETFHDEIMARIAAGDRHHFLVRQKVDYEDYREIRNWPLLRNSRFDGGLIKDERNNTRFYPYDSLARITLGLMMHDTVPLKGLEFAFHEYLKGTEGVGLVRKIAGGNEMPVEIFAECTDGADVQTTINIRMQDIVEDELRGAVLKHDAKFGVAILMETRTGEIKAIANYPEKQNHAVATRVEPGSTFKLASFMAALEDRKLKLDDSMDTGNGTHRFYDRIMRDHLALGKITYRHGFEESSNVLTARMINDAYKAQPEKFFRHLEKFGLTKPVLRQEHLIGEPDPVMVRPDNSEWSGTTLPWMAIGYNTQLTPLQILTFYNAVANNGRMIEPILVKHIRQGSRVLQSFESKVLNSRICSERTLVQVQGLLEGVVQNGTARKLKMESTELAGKTGTAKKVCDNGYYCNIYQASFAGYFPADNPRYTCYVLVDEPSNGQYYGANVAGPVFRNIVEQILAADLDMVPKFNPERDAQASKPVTRQVHRGNAENVYEELEISAPRQAEGTWVKARNNAGKIEFSKVELQPGKVPNVRGMSAKDAVALLEGLGLQVRLNGHGKVKAQSIAAGAALEPRKTIQLELN